MSRSSRTVKADNQRQGFGKLLSAAWRAWFRLAPTTSLVVIQRARQRLIALGMPLRGKYDLVPTKSFNPTLTFPGTKTSLATRRRSERTWSYAATPAGQRA